MTGCEHDIAGCDCYRKGYVDGLRKASEAALRLADDEGLPAALETPPAVAPVPAPVRGIRTLNEQDQAIIRLQLAKEHIRDMPVERDVSEVTDKHLLAAGVDCQ